MEIKTAEFITSMPQYGPFPGQGLAQIAQWLSRYRRYWPQRVQALQTLLKDMDQ